MQRLRALVLLAGALRRGRLAPSIGRPVFDLPLEDRCTLLDAWRREAKRVARDLSLADLPVRIMIDQATADPQKQPAASADLAPARIERDPLDFRGTGGVLRDLAAEYADNDLLLVANAAQVLLEPLGDLLADLAAPGAAVSIISHRDGTASGLLLVRCAALRELPATGFIDMKEQGLPSIAAAHRVMVVERPTASALPVSTLQGYIEALRRHHRRRAGKSSSGSPFEEAWESSFAIVEDDASVGPTARLHDSVVLGGGRVEAGAVVVRSVVCPGGVLRRGRMTVDDLVAPPSKARLRS